MKRKVNNKEKELKRIEGEFKKKCLLVLEDLTKTNYLIRNVGICFMKWHKQHEYTYEQIYNAMQKSFYTNNENNPYTYIANKILNMEVKDGYSITVYIMKVVESELTKETKIK